MNTKTIIKTTQPDGDPVPPYELPLGTVMEVTGDTIPPMGWIDYAHGEEVPERYPELRALITEVWGKPYFPDMRGRQAL